MPEVYIVIESRAKNARDRVVGVSARLQGAELIRVNETRALAAGRDGTLTNEDYRTCYARLRIETCEVRDG